MATATNDPTVEPVETRRHLTVDAPPQSAPIDDTQSAPPAPQAPPQAAAPPLKRHSERLKKYSKSKESWGTFRVLPDIIYTGLGPDEDIVLLLRAHPITQIPWILYTLLVIFFQLFVNFLLGFLGLATLNIFVNILVWSFIMMFIWIKIVSWYYNVGIVTTQNILDIDFYATTFKDVSKVNLKQVDEVSSVSGGFFGSMFDYGNVFVTTQGTQRNVEFLGVPQPARVVDIINDLAAPYGTN